MSNPLPLWGLGGFLWGSGGFAPPTSPRTCGLAQNTCHTSNVRQQYHTSNVCHISSLPRRRERATSEASIHMRQHERSEQKPAAAKFSMLNIEF